MPSESDGSQLQQYLAAELSSAFERNLPVTEALQIARRAYEQHLRAHAPINTVAARPPIPFRQPD